MSLCQVIVCLIVLVSVDIAAAPQSAGRQAIAIGGKRFAEQDILVAILARHLQQSGLSVITSPQLDSPFQKLIADKLDIYVEYLGTALVDQLGLKHQDQAKDLERVRDVFDRKWGVLWEAPLGFSNGFTVVVRSDDFHSKKLRTVSDAAASDKHWSFGCGKDFMTRNDGLIGLLIKYPLKLAREPVEVGIDDVYRRLEEHSADMVIGNSTDAMLDVLPVETLTDDKGYFPSYDAWILVRRKVLAEHPELGPLLQELRGKLPQKKMKELINRVEIEEVPIDRTAAEFVNSMKHKE